jgi:hypothetical protein
MISVMVITVSGAAMECGAERASPLPCDGLEARGVRVVGIVPQELSCALGRAVALALGEQRLDGEALRIGGELRARKVVVKVFDCCEGSLGVA